MIGRRQPDQWGLPLDEPLQVGVARLQGLVAGRWSFGARRGRAAFTRRLPGGRPVTCHPPPANQQLQGPRGVTAADAEVRHLSNCVSVREV